ncbi:Cof-type HAD-IIB family hydrolase [Vibrio sp. F74]|uniref:Cof-type HAD-IIB family hydrolase n=1 Tax=Vibrio sp. F74 TaxID=700020 RepID=UPI0035F5613C
MKYQAVIIDLDGTLLSDDDQICAMNKEAIALALNNGYKVSLASGRPHELMMPYVEQLKLSLPIICCNGAYLYDPKTKQVSNQQSIDTGFVTELLGLLNDSHFDFTIYSSNGVFAQQTSNHTTSLEHKAKTIYTDLTVSIVPNVAELIAQVGDVYKVLVSSQDKGALNQLRDALQTRCQADLSAPNKLDITSLTATKGFALEQWLITQNIPTHNTIAFGDGDNDASMFRLVGEPVAMENASPALKGLANLIVTNNNGCGIGQYLRLTVQEGQHKHQHSFSY